MPEVGVEDAARELGVHSNTIRKRIKAGVLHARKDGRRLLVTLPEDARSLSARESELVTVLREHRDDLRELVRTLSDEVRALREDASVDRKERSSLLEQLADAQRQIWSLPHQTRGRQESGTSETDSG